MSNTLLHGKPIPCNENRVFPVKFSHREIPVMKTGVPAMRTGVPCSENRFFPVWKTSQGKPCSGPVLALYRIAVCCPPPPNITYRYSNKRCLQFGGESDQNSIEICQYISRCKKVPTWGSEGCWEVKKISVPVIISGHSLPFPQA